MDNFWQVAVDVTIILAVAFGAWRGYKEGLLSAIAGILGLVVSLWLAFRLYHGVAEIILKIWHGPESLANIAAFFLLALLLDGLVSMLIMLSSSRIEPRWQNEPWWHWSATVPGAVRYVVLAAYLCSLVLALSVDHPIKLAVAGSWFGPRLALVMNGLAPTQQLVRPALDDLSQLFTIEPGSRDFVTLPFKVAQPQPCAVSVEATMLGLVNEERAKVGAPQLAADNALREVGRRHSLDMFRQGYFSHYTPDDLDPFDRMDAAGITYQAAGENLALAPTVQAAHIGLMNSPGHKRNILNPQFHKLGIGCYESPRHGLMFSQEFSN